MRPSARALALVLAVLVSTALVGGPASAQTATGSAVTKTGKTSGIGDFSTLAVTVSQTAGLVNQTVRVTWTGGAPTVGRIQANTPQLGNYLQIMQCWGDDLGPDRTQCLFGTFGTGFVTDNRSAKVSLGQANDIVDPLETLTPLVRDTTNIPFWPVVQQVRPTTAVGGADATTNPYLDIQATNEVPAVATRPDGTGEIDVEVQTLVESNGLGCGAPLTGTDGSVKGRSCWLVVVPRGTVEVNGQPPGPQGLVSSALSPTNWNNKIEFRLDFVPQGKPCPSGAAEQPISGHELAVDAVSSWQPTLCSGGGNLYAFTQLTDDRSRQLLTAGGNAGLSVFSDPVPADAQVADRPIVYAPLALSALTVAFKIIRRPDTQVPEGDPRREGEGSPFTSMKLTPRLVAKLLTESYRGVEPAQDPGQPLPPGFPASTVASTSPQGLTNDPEFLTLNPEYKDRLRPNLYVDVLVQAGTSDLTGQLWRWVLGDPDARAFVDGASVNSANKNPQLPLTVYPRNDKFCVVKQGVINDLNNASTEVKFCTSDTHIYANDMHEAGRSASRGDQLAGDINNVKFQLDNSYAFSKRPRQLRDEQALIAVVDTATAARYGLATASLRNAAGEFVAPDQAGLTAGLAAMKPSATKEVLAPDPAAADPAAYPLTSLSYAAAVPAALPATAGKVWGTFLRYAAGPGQQPGQQVGQLPAGYAPLPDALRQQTLAAAATIESQAGKGTATPTPLPPPAPTPAPAAQAPATSGGVTTGSAPGGGGSSATPATGDGSTGSGTPAAGTDSGTATTTGAGTGAAAAGGVGTGTGGSGSAASAGTGAAAPAVVAPAGTVGTQQVAESRPTPTIPAPAVGTLLMVLLIGGGLAAAAAPATHLLSTRRSTAEGGDETDRTTARRATAWLPARPALFARRR